MEEPSGSDAYAARARGVTWLFGRRWFTVAFAALTLALIAFVASASSTSTRHPSMDPDPRDGQRARWTSRRERQVPPPGAHFSVSGETFVCDVVFGDGSTGHVSVEVLNDPGFWAWIWSAESEGHQRVRA